MILTVTLNAAIDKRYVVNNFKTGEVNRVKAVSYTHHRCLQMFVHTGAQMLLNELQDMILKVLQKRTMVSSI